MNSPNWISCGKTIKDLIEELKTFENQELEVKISIDDGDTFKPISIVTKEIEGDTVFCGICNSEKI